MSRILIVDDEESISGLLKYALEREGYTVETAADGYEATDKYPAFKPDLMLLDVMMPNKDGYQVCREISGRCPIIMLTAKGDILDKIAGLELGADDYITKPFDIREVVTRVKALLRRSARQPKPEEKQSARSPEEKQSGMNPEEPQLTAKSTEMHSNVEAGAEFSISQSRRYHSQSTQILHNGALTINDDHKSVSLNGSELELTPIEYSLLTLFTRNINKVFSRDELLDKVWGYEYIGETRSVDIHMQRLRKKLGSWEKHIKTVYGMGYKMVKDNGDR